MSFEFFNSSHEPWCSLTTATQKFKKSSEANLGISVKVFASLGNLLDKFFLGPPLILRLVIFFVIERACRVNAADQGVLELEPLVASQAECERGPHDAR